MYLRGLIKWKILGSLLCYYSMEYGRNWWHWYRIINFTLTNTKSVIKPPNDRYFLASKVLSKISYKRGSILKKVHSEHSQSIRTDFSARKVVIEDESWCNGGGGCFVNALSITFWWIRVQSPPRALFIFWNNF